MSSNSIPLGIPRRSLGWLAAHWNRQRARLESASGQHRKLFSPSSQEIQELLEAILGVQIPPELLPAASLQVSWLISYLGRLQNSISDALPPDAATTGLYAALFNAMKAISRIIQSDNSISFKDLVDGLVTEGLIVVSSNGASSGDDPSQSLVQSLLGCMTMLYLGATGEMAGFEVDRPILEFLHKLGALIPSLPSDNSRLVELHVSNLNVQTLMDIGELTINWTTLIGDHLKFDPSTQVLSLFCLPSFCKLHMSSQGPPGSVPLIERVLDGYYWNDPYSSVTHTFNMASFSHQLCATYRLLFANSNRACAIYEKSERQRARDALLLTFDGLSATDPVSDSYLDDLCRSPSPLDASFPARQTYDAFHDMPYFADRLQSLQHYILCQNPNRAKLLWKDRRDALRWYTFWAAVTIGGITIVLGVTQTALSAAQVALAAKQSS